MSRRNHFDRVFVAALVCSAALVGNYLGLRSIRDALFQNWDIKTALPNIKIVTALLSVGTALLMSRILSRRSPQWLLPRVLAVSAASLLLVWGLVFYDEKAAGVAIYFQMALFAGVMISAFWLMVNANYDPRSAKKLIGLIGAGGTAGGVLACLMVALLRNPRIVLPVFAGLHVVVAALIPVLVSGDVGAKKSSKGDANADRRWGFNMLREVPYLRTIALIILFASMTSFYLDYVLQSTVKTAYAGHSASSRTAFFGWYYTVVPVVTFLMQSVLSRVALERAGLALTAAIAPLSAVLGGVVSFFIPGLRSVVATRGAEMSLRNSFFKSAYEIFFLPIPAGERRAARSTIDVGADSMGDILGGASAAVLRFVVPAAALNQTALSIVVVFSLCGLFLVWRLKSAYVAQLEVSVMNRSVELDIADVQDLSTRNLMYKTIAVPEAANLTPAMPAIPKAPVVASVTGAGRDPLLERAAALRSGDKERIRVALSNSQPLDSALAGLVIALLENDQVVRHAIEALMGVAAANTGQLVDALLDQSRSPVVRRRIARLMLACGNQRAADGLLLGLRDGHFELRMVCARALANLTAKNPEICVLAEDVFGAVLREIDESREPDTLEHIFTLLSMALPREPLQTAFEALRSGDAQLRGTMLEYLECTLPPRVREELWPMLEEVQAAR